MIQELDAAVLDAVTSAGRTAGTIRVNTLGMAAKSIISTRLGRFHQAYPDVILDIVVDDSLSDIVAGRFDIGIRVGRKLERDMTVVRLTPDIKIVVAASPDYLSRYGEPTSPTDLHRHSCINWRLPGRDAISGWEFEKKGKKTEINAQGPLICNRQDVAVAAALQGLGILYAYDDDGADHAIKTGALKQILPRLVSEEARTLSLLSESPPHAASTACLHRLPARKRTSSLPRVECVRQPPRLTVSLVSWRGRWFAGLAVARTAHAAPCHSSERACPAWT